MEQDKALRLQDHPLSKLDLSFDQVTINATIRIIIVARSHFVFPSYIFGHDRRRDEL